MPYIPIYLHENDVQDLNLWLNNQESIAFLVSNGDRRWIAQKENNILEGKDMKDNRKPTKISYKLWHVPSGKLPLLKKMDDNSGEAQTIDNPWLGWEELYPGADSSVPYFGAGCTGIFNLTVKIGTDQLIEMSTLNWIGNRYKIIGDGALESTEKFWRKLRAMIKGFSTQIPRANRPGGKPEVFAFRQAFKEIENGIPCALNP